MAGATIANLYYSFIIDTKRFHFLHVVLFSLLRPVEIGTHFHTAPCWPAGLGGLGLLSRVTEDEAEENPRLDYSVRVASVWHLSFI